MNNFSAWLACVALACWLGREFTDWIWSFWDDGMDDPPSFPLLAAAWRAWEKLDRAWLLLWLYGWWPVTYWLERTWPRLFPLEEPLPLPMDADGRTPEEWLAISAVGVWKLECWYKDEYDWQVKKNWDEFLSSQRNGHPDQLEAGQEAA